MTFVTSLLTPGHRIVDEIECVASVLLAIVHENYVHDHGYDVRPRHLAVAKPAPP